MRRLIFPKGGIPIQIRIFQKNKRWMIAGIAVVAVALAVFLGVLIWGLSLKNSHKVFPNVCVSGVNIGGMET